MVTIIFASSLAAETPEMLETKKVQTKSSKGCIRILLTDMCLVFTVMNFELRCVCRILLRWESIWLYCASEMKSSRYGFSYLSEPNTAHVFENRESTAYVK